MNQCLLQNLLESILREHVHLPYGMNVDLTNSWSSSCELSSLTCHSGCCFLFSLLLQAALRWPSCLTTVVTNGFSMATLVEWCVLFSQRWHMIIIMLICGFTITLFSWLLTRTRLLSFSSFFRVWTFCAAVKHYCIASFVIPQTSCSLNMCFSVPPYLRCSANECNSAT